ncbi:antA/AntB antirepressor family protein [Pectobacterium polaris]|uniref:antA/AntB antirepressor family protein n=1 Tax=Pectobacterium polaris TaxID=2042057 RepID=UPI000EA1EF98|nr:antA/AntB antirepressor family protein [Pectobacterium polaris]MDE8753854.1 antA/AntB antirepressor family protein [Pectobacterium polaris]RJL20066.1 phage antirepressor Ant [Pectobacterium polaris]
MTQKKITALTGSGQTQPETSQKDNSGNSFATRIPVTMSNIGGKETQSVRGRKLHTFLAVGRDFTTWIKARIKQYGFVEGVDYVIVEDLSTPKRGSAKSRQQIEHDYILSLNTGKELSMVERTDQGKQARQYFIDCEERLRRVAPEEHQAALLNWRRNRVAACEDHKSMADAMKCYIERTGDKQHGFAYSNECSFLNELVLGVHPRTWAKQKGIATKQVRDHMNADQLALLAYLGSRDCALLDLDTPTITRKAKLTELAQRWLAKRLLGVSDAK